jgi:subtilisin family serine protease
MPESNVDTEPNRPHEDSDIDFIAAGRRTGHGLVWLWAPPFAMPPAPGWESVADPPVIALLDTEIRDHHRWLKESTQGIQWRVSASEDGESDATTQADERMPVGGFYGHGTFIAGLIRRRAPGAQLLLLPVMDENGHVEDGDLADALRQLAAYQDRHRRRMVVLMAFGRKAETENPDDDEDLQRVKQALIALARPGVVIVASAGNGRTDLRQFPAAFADDPDLSASVVSVGAGKAADDPDPFSNFGPWVREWRRGTNIVSLMPLAPTGLRRVDGEPFEIQDVDTSNYAWWSGTSFAATIYACEQARDLVIRSSRVAAPVTGP